MPSTHLNLREDDVVRLALEFLHNRDLHITQLSLERETGVINGNYADDVLFLRQLILDGQWDDVLEFIQPLSALKEFEADKFNYAILRHKYIELLCIRSEIKAYNNVENVVDEVVKVLSDLEKIAPSKEEYSNLCLLLTLPSITDHAQFKKWNPSNARVQCFREVYPLVEQFLPCDKKTSGNTISKCAKNDRLMQLLIKGILYESCVNYCQAKATGSKEAQSNEVNFSRLLDGSGFDESDLSLLSWLQSIPAETFSVPFEQRMLNVDVEKLERPSLHTSWTEHMLVTPIKPRTFPHLAMPFRRPRSAADAMTRSLRPLPDGAPRHPTVMALSAIDYGPSSSCFAGFHLTGIKSSKLMNTSVDRLFDNKNGDSTYNGLNESLKPIEEQLKPVGDHSTGGKNDTSSVGASNATTPEHRGQDCSVSTSISTTAASTERSSLAERLPNHPEPIMAAAAPPGDFRRELLKEYQIQKQRECDDYLRNLCSSELRENPTEQSDTASGFQSAVKYPNQTAEKLREQPHYTREVESRRSPDINDSVNLPKTPDDWLHISKTFQETWNFPHCVGAIDGKHIVLQCPVHSGTEFYNYKSFFSIVLFALVDGNCNFLFVDIGCQGRISDGGIFKNSKLWEMIQNGSLNLPPPETFLNRQINIPYFFCGDSAFSLHQNVMVPYRGNHDIRSKERIFNYRLSRARRNVENAFGIISAMFRVLRKPMLLEPEKAELIVLTTVYLHNYLRSNNTNYNVQILNDTQENTPFSSFLPITRIPRRSAADVKKIRDEIADYCVKEGKVEWQEKYA